MTVWHDYLERMGEYSYVNKYIRAFCLYYVSILYSFLLYLCIT